MIKRVPVLLTVIGGKTYNLLRTLIYPDKPSIKSFDQIVAILQGHLSPKPAERFRFHKRDQRDDENINTFFFLAVRNHILRFSAI